MITEIKIKRTNFEGVTEITADGWDGKVLRMSHRTYLDWRASSVIPKIPCAYVLYVDHFDRTRHGNELYVGHTGKIGTRLDDHVVGKNYWSIVLITHSLEDWMNVAFTQNIEYSFINWAKFANRYKVMNGNDSAPTHLGDADRKKLDDFLLGAREVLALADVDLFKLNMDGAFINTQIMGRKRFQAIARILTIGTRCRFSIDAGSVIWSNKKDADIDSLSGVIYDDNDRTYTFMQQVEVDVVKSNSFPKLLGSSLSRWDNSCGISLREVIGDALQ